MHYCIHSVEDRGHLQVLARLSRLISSTDLVASLRAAPNAKAVHDLIKRAEEAIRK